MSTITDTERINKIDNSLCTVYRGIKYVLIEDLEVATVGDGEYKGDTLREAIDAWIAADEERV